MAVKKQIHMIITGFIEGAEIPREKKHENFLNDLADLCTRYDLKSVHGENDCEIME